MMLEISPQYHSIVLGEHQQNVKKIMEHTGVQILFPDPHDPYTPSLKKSSVTISGSIHKVYAARQMLLVNLCTSTKSDFICHLYKSYIIKTNIISGFPAFGFDV